MRFTLPQVSKHECRRIVGKMDRIALWGIEGSGPTLPFNLILTI